MDWPHLFSDCGPLEHPCNGIAHASDGTTIDQQAWYECDLGYVLSLPDPVVRICGEDGIWSGEAPCCDPGNSFIHRNCLIDKHLLVFIIHYPVHMSLEQSCTHHPIQVRGYTTFFMLNSAEHGIYHAHK